MNETKQLWRQAQTVKDLNRIVLTFLSAWGKVSIMTTGTADYQTKNRAFTSN